MAEKTLVGLMGEQPIPLLLSIREQQPDHVLIVYTKRTKERAGRLQEIIVGEVNKITLVESAAYDLRKVMEDIQANLPKDGEVIFDVTGGTKVMSLAAALIAQQQRSKITYIITENSQGRILTLGNPIEEQPLSLATFTLKEYLALYLGAGNFTFETPPPKNRFEKVVYEALDSSSHFDEILCAVKRGDVDIDIAVRCGIQVGIVEVKQTSLSKKHPEYTKKKGIDQLNTAGGQKFLGTWVKKFYVIDEKWDKGANLRALAKARNIKLIELPSFTESPPAISPEDKEKLVETIRQAMACK